MVESNPAFADDICAVANDFRLMQAGLVCVEGVSSFDGLRVTETIPASGDVMISAGHAFVANDNGTPGGVYHVYNDAPILLTVPLNSSGVDRTDVVWLRVCDLEYGPPSGFTVFYDDNNPTATPPADLCSYYLLATIVVPNGAGSGGTNVTGSPDGFGTTDTMITDNRELFTTCGGQSVTATTWTRTTNQVIAHTTETVVSYNAGPSGSTVPNQFFSQSAGTVTFNTPGLYDVIGTVLWQPLTTGIFQRARLYLGASLIGRTAVDPIQSATVQSAQQVTAVAVVTAAGQQLQLRVEQGQSAPASLILEFATLQVVYRGTLAA